MRPTNRKHAVSIRRVCGLTMSVLVVVLGVVVAPGDARASGAHHGGLVFRMFPLGGGSSGCCEPNREPWQIVRGADGNMWFTVTSNLSAVAPAIVRITPSGRLTFFRHPNVGRTEYVAEGYDGDIWLISGGLSSTNIERINPSGHLTELPDPDADSYDPISQGPGGDMWFAGTEAGDRTIIGSVTESGTITPFALPARENVESIVQGPDGNLWFTLVQPVEGGAREHVGRMTPSGQVTLYPTPTSSCPPYGMAVGPDHALWFAEGCGKIGRVTTAGRITEFTIPGMRGCSQIVSGPDGDLWFTCNGAYPAIGKITPSGKATVFRVPGPADAGVYGLAFSNPRTLWFTETYAAKVGRATLP